MREGGSSLNTPFHTFKILEPQRGWIGKQKYIREQWRWYFESSIGRKEGQEEGERHAYIPGLWGFPSKKSHTKAFSHTLSHFLLTMSPGGEYSVERSPFLGRRRKQVQNGYDLSAATLPNPVSWFSPLRKTISQNLGAKVWILEASVMNCTSKINLWKDTGMFIGIC